MSKSEPEAVVVDDDAPLPQPVPYYNPEAPNLRFRLLADPGSGRTVAYERFHHGRFVAQTPRHEEAVRRVLGRFADAWSGDDTRTELACENPACDFRTRNSAAFAVHQQRERLRGAVKPDLPGQR